MPLRFFFYSLLISSCINAQNDNKIVIGAIDSLYSDVLKEKRKIWVSVPEGFKSGIYAPMKYPVVYLLDGDNHFQSVTGMLQGLSASNVTPEMIVVAIPNTNRTRDLTPTNSAIGPDGKEAPFMRGSGGGELFTKFLKEELIPFIDSLYPAAPYRMFIGHSLGGLLVMNTLINHPEMFNSYIAIDPSMWWDDQKLLRKADSFLQQNKLDGKSLFLAVANTMNDGMNITKVKKDTSSNTMHIRSNLQLVSLLEKHKKNNLTWNWKYYNDDSHGSVPIIAEYDAFRSFFKHTALKLPGSPEDTAFFTINYIKKHYEGVTKSMGYKVLPPEEMINTIAYQFMAIGMMNKAQSLLQLNIDNYPQSFNVFDSMGDLYAEKEDRDKAVEYFLKALAIKEYPPTRKKVEALSIAEIQLPAATLEKYRGEYEMAPGFILTVSVRDNLVYAQGTGQPETQIFASKEDHFFLKAVPAQIEFVKNSSGVVEKLILRQGGQEMEGKKIKR